MPEFKKAKPEECVTAFDQWIYVLKNMEIMERMPFVSTKEMFRRLDSVVSYAALSESEKKRYDAELKAYRDITNQLSYAEKKGREEGAIAAKKSTALRLLQLGLPDNEIAWASGLPLDEVKVLKAAKE